MKARRTHDEAMAETPFKTVDDRAWLTSLPAWLTGGAVEIVDEH
jgi:hypothetical protein